tara:strand:- start:327 stop:647 length:321 start_codon:yes stop_codon:yes gene_type:complete
MPNSHVLEFIGIILASVISFFILICICIIVSKKREQNLVVDIDFNRFTTVTNNTECSICLDSDENEKIKLECDHSFHKNCLEEWYIKSKNKNCPVCRQLIDNTSSV